MQVSAGRRPCDGSASADGSRVCRGLPPGASIGWYRLSRQAQTGSETHLEAAMTTRRQLALLVSVVLAVWLAPAVGATAREETPTEVHVSLSGTLEASTSVPGPTSGISTETVSVKFSEKQTFAAATGDPTSRPKLQVTGTETFFDDRTFEGINLWTPADRCTGKLSAKPYRQWSFIALMSGSVDQFGPSKDFVNGFAYVPAASFNTSSFIRSKGEGDCAAYAVPIDPSEDRFGGIEDRWLASHATDRAHFRDTELAFNVRHQPFRWKSTVFKAKYALELIDRASFTTS